MKSNKNVVNPLALASVASQTGPKSTAGKKVSSKNSRKSSIFVKGYLPWEDVEQKQLMHQQLCDQWDANDPTKQILISTIEQGHLELERIMFAQKQKVEGAMQSLNIAQEFCKQAGLSILSAQELPSWYFADDGGQKENAIWLDEVWLEASKFQKSFHDSLIPTIAQRYPKLYEYVMDGQPNNASFLLALGQRYKQSTPVLNLSAVMNEISEEYGQHLQWAADPVRYQTIIDGIRGNQMMLAMDLDKTTRYITGIQNRILKGITGLVGLKQLDAANDVRMIELEAKSIEQAPSQDISNVDEGDAEAA
jgi:hypothetical protein